MPPSTGVSHDFRAGSRSGYTAAGLAQKAADFVLALGSAGAAEEPERRAA